jgi:choline dehydrogenase-like flavoprotein
VRPASLELVGPLYERVLRCHYRRLGSRRWNERLRAHGRWPYGSDARTGRDYQPLTETPMFNLPAETPLRSSPTPDKEFGFYDATVNGGWQVPGEPYTVAEGSEFKWWRPRMLGGRTNHWGRFSPRLGPYDFKPYSRDGLGVDWPFSYDDIASWYDKTERLIGVTGAAHGIENCPDSPADLHPPPPPPSLSDYFFARGAESLGIRVAAIRAAILTRPLNGRPSCIYATDCVRGCAIRANFQSTTVLLPPALQSGRLTIRTQAVVYQVDLDRRGRASGVSFVDRGTGTHHHVKAGAVVLAAGACESARILLNPKSSLFPHGLANESGQVGRNLMDSVRTGVMAQFPALEGLPPRQDDGLGGGGGKPRVCALVGLSTTKTTGFSERIHALSRRWARNARWFRFGGFRTRLCEHARTRSSTEIRQKYGSYGTILGTGDMIPNQHSFCDIDPTVKDRWGIPVLRFHWKWGEYELRQAAHMRHTALSIIDRLGGRVTLDMGGKPTTGGEVIHKVGVTRMGNSHKNSVANQFGQSWSVKNLFVMDGGVFASMSDKSHPTLTILALAWRNSAYLAEQARKGNL